MKKVLYVDLDGVMADSIPWWLALHNRETKEVWTKADIKKWDDASFLAQHFSNYDFVLPVEGAFSAIKRLQSKYRIVFATSGSGSDWLTDRMGACEIVQIQDKSLLRGFALIDDNPVSVKNFSSHPGQYGFVLKQPWNEGETWQEIEGWLNAYFISKSTD